NPKPGSRLAVGTIGERLEISSVTVSRRMRSTGSTLVTVIVQATGSPKWAMGMGTQDVHSPPGHWSADVHRSPPLGPPTQMVAVQMPFGTPGGLSQSRSLAHASVPFGPPPAFGPPRQTVRGGQPAALRQVTPALTPGQPGVVPCRHARRAAVTQRFSSCA